MRISKMKIQVLLENHTGNDDRLSAEHGLSLYVETGKHRLLADTGASDLTWDNAAVLGVDLTKIDTVVISHGHYDHAGGLLGFAAKKPDADIYMQRSAGGDFYHDEKYIGIDKRILQLPRLHLLDGDLVIDEELALYAGVTGRKLWPRSNRLLSEIRDGNRQQDEFEHEQFLVITERDESRTGSEDEAGPARQAVRRVMISGCAHNGILNLLDRFRDIYGTDPDVVISGFHMMKREAYTPEEEAEILETARILTETDTIWYTGHCTGEKAYDLMAPVMGERLQAMHTGMEIRV